MKNQSIKNHIDWISVLLYAALVLLGWLNIFSSSAPVDMQGFSFDLDQIYGKQLLFIILTIPLIITLFAIDGKFYEKYSSIFFAIALVLVAGLFVFGRAVKGQANWYHLGPVSLQPAEFAKTATALALAKYLSDAQVNLAHINRQWQAIGIIALPILLIAPNDPGSALIFCSFFFVLYREGLPAWYLQVGFVAIILFVLCLLISPWYIIGGVVVLLLLDYFRSRLKDRNLVRSAFLFLAATLFTLSVSYVFENVFQDHHRDRFNVLLGKEVDMQGVGYNINQSKIAIGSGGWFGKGFREGTQTKGGFVPEQHTDYIFTTVGEEWGFIGSLVVIFLFAGLILRVIQLAENQRTKFSRVYGYGVASILFMHFLVNIAMVVGIFPTVGVPLPFFSYGGSGLWGFTILLFIFLKMDANKVNEW